MSLYLRQMELGPMQNFVYLVGDSEVKKCWIVDPAWEVERAVAQAERDGYAIEGALLTHGHYDHCNGLESLLKIRHVPVYVQKEEPEISRLAGDTGIFGVLPKESLKIVKPGDKISLGGVQLTFLHTPGHTPGSQCFLVNNNLLSGDTLFLGTCGRCDLPGGNPMQLFESLNRVIGKLPSDTVLFPGHNYSPPDASATLESAKKKNRFFQAHTLEEFLGMMGV
jgi:hydroxyacylglutathione hydrolase